MKGETAAFLPESLFVDVEQLDEQHAGLFSRLAGLKMLCIETNEFPAEESAALLQALREHCATEERLAGESGLDFAAHAGKHAKMLAAIDKAVQEIHEHKIDVFSVLRYIEYWFERHIAEEDRNLARKLRQHPAETFRAGTSFMPALAARVPPHAAPRAPFRP